MLDIAAWLSFAHRFKTPTLPDGACQPTAKITCAHMEEIEWDGSLRNRMR
jgi:hypothetical protein